MLNPNSHLFQRQYQQRYKTDKSQKKLVLHIYKICMITNSLTQVSLGINLTNRRIV